MNLLLYKSLAFSVFSFIKRVPMHSRFFFFFFFFFLLLLVVVVAVIIIFLLLLLSSSLLLLLLSLLLLLLAVSFCSVTSHLYPVFIDPPFLILILLTCFAALFSII